VSSQTRDVVTEEYNVAINGEELNWHHRISHIIDKACLCLEMLREVLSGSCQYCRNLRLLPTASLNSVPVPVGVDKYFICSSIEQYWETLI